MAVCVNCSTPLPDGTHYCGQCGTPVPGRTEERPTLTPQGREIFDRLQKATAGRYEIIRELGRGGMAVVFLGFQNSLDRHIAIKVLLPLLAYDPEIVERFLREARTQARLDHPSIIAVYEIYNEGGLTFFTMPYLSGRSLRQYLKDQPKPPVEKVRKYLCQAAEALAYAHRRGVIHRDVKPDNMLLDLERDGVILTDFGIAKALAAETTLTTPGDLLGTPQYMSPEQGEGKHDLDGRADQYSLGLIGYEMLAGIRPFQAENLAELMYKHRFEDPVHIDELRPDAPAHLREAISRAIRKDREERFSTMEEFLAALEGRSVSEEAEERTELIHGPDPDTTVRVPTPPSLGSGAGRPPAASTTPDRAAPPSAGEEPDLELTTPEPWAAPREKTPPPRERTPPPRESTPPPRERTPAPSSAGQRAGGRASAGALADTAVMGPAPRRRGLPWVRLVGGGTLVAAALAAFFVFGPLGSGDRALDRTLGGEELSAGETEPGGTAPEGGAAPDADPAGDAEPVGGGDEPLAAGGGDTGAPSTGEPEAGDAGAEGSAAERARTQAEGARGRARQAREDAAATAGVDRAALARLDDRMEGAERELRAGRYDAAWRAFSDLIRDYRGLVTSVSAERATALEARQAAQGARTAAANAGAGTTDPSQLANLDERLNAAERDMQASRYSQAASAYRALVGEYESLAERASRELRSRADRARDSMEQGRRAALEAGAPDRAADRLAAADATRNEALRLLQAGDPAGALPRLEQARQAYEALAASLPAEPPDEPEPEPEAGGGAASAEAVIGELIERFRTAFEQEDFDRLAAEVYRSELPEDDRQLLNYVFSRADDLQAASTVQGLRVRDANAVADVRLDLSFQQSQTGRSQTSDLELRLTFVLDAGTWRLDRIERR